MSGKLRIGVLTSLYPTPDRPFEGIFAERRWSGMSERGHDVRVVQPTPRVPWPLGFMFPRRFGDLSRRPNREQRGSISVERPRYTHISGRDVANAKRFAERGLDALVTESWSPDIVVCDYAWPAGAVAPLCALRQIPCTLSGRGSDVLQAGGEAGLGEELGSYLRAAGSWFAVSADLVHFMDALAATPDRAGGTLVPNGVNSELFRPLSPTDRAEARRAFGWAPDDQVVLLVGHLIARKDPLLAIDSFFQYQTLSLASGQKRLILIGKGELQAEVEQAVAAGDSASAVTLIGECDASLLSRYYAAADCLLLCSKREGRPNVVLEALSSGLPVVATEAGGTGELLALGPCPVVRTREPSAIANALSNMLNQPPARGVIRKSVAGLSWQASLDILESLLHNHAKCSVPLSKS